MLISHLPAGYLLGHSIGVNRPLAWATLLGASILPDLDLIWFYLIDGRATHHHRYLVHIPAFWTLIAAPLALLAWGFARPLLPYIALAYAALILHCVIDSFTGGILWAWPFSNQLYALIQVPATQSNWILSFVFHWTFLVELAICATAVFLFVRKRP